MNPSNESPKQAVSTIECFHPSLCFIRNQGGIPVKCQVVPFFYQPNANPPAIFLVACNPCPTDPRGPVSAALRRVRGLWPAHVPRGALRALRGPPLRALRRRRRRAPRRPGRGLGKRAQGARARSASAHGGWHELPVNPRFQGARRKRLELMKMGRASRNFLG